MHICHYVTTNDVAFVHTTLQPLCDALQKEGHRVTYMTSTTNTQISELLHSPTDSQKKGLKIDVALSGFQKFRHLRRLLKELRPNVLHIHGPLGAQHGTCAARSCGITVVHSAESSTWSQLPAWVWKSSQAIVLPGDTLKTTFSTKGLATPTHLHVLPPVVDVTTTASPEAVQDFKETQQIKPDDFVIGHLGGLNRTHDVETLLKAVRKCVAKEIPAVVLLEAGGTQEKTLEGFVQNNALGTHVRFLTDLPAQATFFGALNAYVDSSFTATYPANLLRAMQAGVPVVATKIGEHPDIVQDNVTGYLVPCGFPERIESALKKIEANKAAAKKLGQAAAQQIQTHHSPAAVFPKYMALYQHLSR